jgi:hypothetical protein
MTARRIAAADTQYLDHILKANRETGGLSVTVYKYHGSGTSERNYRLLVSFAAHPKNLLPGSSKADPILLHWEIGGLVPVEDDLYYMMNFVKPLNESNGDTNVLFHASIIHNIVKDYADSNPTVVPMLNDCIGLERIQVLPLGDGEFGIALIAPD